MSLVRLYRHGLRVGIRDFLSFWSWKSWCAGWMLRIVSNAFLWVLLGRLINSRAQQEFLLVGNSVAAGAAAAVWASNATVWFRYDGTYALLVASPSRILPVVIGRTSVWLFNGVATSFATLIILVLAFGLRLEGPGVFAVPLIVVLICASAFCFALFLGALISRRPRLRNFALDLTGMAFMAFCGVSVPVTFWPASVQTIANALPVTHGLLAIRTLLAGGSISSALPQIGCEGLVAFAWLAVSTLIAERLANAGRADGSIELIPS